MTVPIGEVTRANYDGRRGRPGGPAWRVDLGVGLFGETKAVDLLIGSGLDFLILQRLLRASDIKARARLHLKHDAVVDQHIQYAGEI